MNKSLQEQIRAMFPNVGIRVYAMPNGGMTHDIDEAKEAWLWYSMVTNVKKCHVAGKNKYYAGRL